MADVMEMKKAHKTLKQWNYKWTPIDRGYTDKILYINLNNSEVKEKNVPPQMKEKFIGGKGYGLRLLWDATKPDTKWNDPENEIVRIVDGRHVHAVACISHRQLQV